MAAKLTVITPMFNSGATIAGSLDSLIAQTFTDWRCVVVDDGSTDGGPATVREYTRRDERIRMVSQPNMGLPGARNTGLEEALRDGSEFIHFLDSDDWMHPCAFEWLLPAAAKLGGSYAGYELCGPDGVSLGRQSPMSAPVVGLDEQLDWNRTMTHAHLFAASMIGDCRFDERLRVVEDYDMWLRLAMRGERWQGVERIVCGYRLRPGSMSKRFGAMAECIEQALFKAFREAAALGWGQRIDLSDARRLRVCGGNALAYSTMEALLDPDPHKDRAAALMRSRHHPGRFSPFDMAQHASTSLLFGACTAPDLDGRSERWWLTALSQWWGRCADEGWLDEHGPDAAMAELSRKIVHPALVCASLLDAVSPRPSQGAVSIVIVGLDRNGRRLARRAAERGLVVLALDDFSSDAEIELLEPLPNVLVVRDRDAFPGAARAVGVDAPWLTGLLTADAAKILGRIATDARAQPRHIEFWNDHRERFGSANLEKMQDALRTPVEAAA